MKLLTSRVSYSCHLGPIFQTLLVHQAEFSIKTLLASSYICLCHIIHNYPVPIRGNVYYGEAPYETGTESCTQCPYDKPYCKANLCGE